MNKTILKTAIIAAAAITLLSACKKEEVEQKALTADEKIIATTDSARDLLLKAKRMDGDRLKQKQASAEPETATDGADNMSAIIFDGSTEDAFNQGLDEFQKLATAQEYNDLTNSLKYLLVYDLASRGNKAHLYALLDGMTPAEIAERAGNIGK